MLPTQMMPGFSPLKIDIHAESGLKVARLRLRERRSSAFQEATGWRRTIEVWLSTSFQEVAVIPHAKQRSYRIHCDDPLRGRMPMLAHTPSTQRSSFAWSRRSRPGLFDSQMKTLRANLRPAAKLSKFQGDNGTSPRLASDVSKTERLRPFTQRSVASRPRNPNRSANQ